MSALLEDLNAEQRAAVLHEGGPLLLLAGAGSGKTRVITRRIAWLILEKRVDPLGVLAITFTNKAAREMKERVAAFVPRSDLWVSTFHSAAVRILRREAAGLGLRSDFTIYDTYDRGQCLRAVVRELELDDQSWKPGPLGHRISGRKNRGIAPGAADPDAGFVDEVFAKIERAYAEKMAKSGALDFDDLLLKLLELLEGNSGARERYARRFEEVLVDEYQDTNAIQYRIVKALASERRNLTVCGDPDQSIYGWRGADLRNILDFERDFAPATVLRLERNYRSTSRILAAAQGVIERNVLRKEKKLVTDAAEGEKVAELVSRDELDEARSIVGRIRSLTESEVKRSDIAIFYRANFLQRALERGLRDAGIPYRVASGLEFFERREIKDLIAYLRLLANPRDDVSFERVLNVPTRGIGDTTLDKLRSEALRAGEPMIDAAGRSSVRAAFTTKVRNSLERFLAMVESLKPRIEGPAEAVLEALIAATGYIEHCADLGDAGDLDRAENVRELVASAAEYDRREPEGGARGFLSEVALVSDVDRIDGEADRVTMMTLHSAKGLEFPVVFVAGCEEGLLPHRRSIEERAGDEGLEEERRLFYVGITRARQRLFLSRAQYRAQFGGPSFDGGERTLPSRFLDEIPAAVFERGPAAHADPDVDDDVKFDVAPAVISESLAFRAGETVVHAHFGVGRVVELRGSGANAKAVVHFRGIGEKQLLLQYAHLERVAGAR